MSDLPYTEQYMNLYRALGKPKAMRDLAERIESVDIEDVRQDEQHRQEQRVVGRSCGKRLGRALRLDELDEVER
jgi:hypothetical protein